MTVSNDGLRDRAWLEVRLAAIQSNAKAVHARAGVPLLPMVKAEAYGLGMLPVVRALEELDPWGYGVATLEEGLALRAADVSRPVVVFTPPVSSWAKPMRDAGLQPALGHAEGFALWRGAGGGPWQLDIDTGMGRSGIPWESVDRIPATALDECVGAFTHFACADFDAEATAVQLSRFSNALSRLPKRPELVHAANSAAVFRGPEYALDVVRPGIFLYGGRPGAHAPEPEPAAAFRARVVHVQKIAAGAPASYGWRWHAESEAEVASVGAGYGDGVPRALEAKGELSLRAARRPIVGAINMDVTLVHVPTGEVRSGDVATFFGDEIALDEWAAWGGTNAYEALTGIGRRIPRVYV